MIESNRLQAIANQNSLNESNRRTQESIGNLNNSVQQFERQVSRELQNQRAARQADRAAMRDVPREVSASPPQDSVYYSPPPQQPPDSSPSDEASSGSANPITRSPDNAAPVSVRETIPPPYTPPPNILESTVAAVRNNETFQHASL
jgi:hypothetical protein